MDAELIRKGISLMTSEEIKRGLEAPYFGRPERWIPHYDASRNTDFATKCFLGCAFGGWRIATGVLADRGGGDASSHLSFGFDLGGNNREFIRQECIRELAERGIIPEPTLAHA